MDKSTRSCTTCGTQFVAVRAQVCEKCKNREKVAKRERVPCYVCGGPTSWYVTDKRRTGDAKHGACPSPHGTGARYASGCRCDECRAEVNRAGRERTARLLADPSTGPRCTEEGCNGIRRGNGMCSKHYKRYLKAVGKWKPSPSDRWDYPANRARASARKALYRGAQGTARLTVHDLMERDGNTCEICDEGIDANIAYPNAASPSIDHITPISRGGRHDDENLRATHLICNIKRGNRTSDRTELRETAASAR